MLHRAGWPRGRELGSGPDLITEYQRHWNENERKAYRLQKEFRDLWPEYETPNELARQVVRFLDKKTSNRDAASLPLKVQVTA
jgi:hypothetical protein